jgi:flagellar biosynthesis protein FlhG
LLDQADQLRQLARDTALRTTRHPAEVAVMVVSGARPGEGTSTVSHHLATQLALLGRRVVLVDANLLNCGLTRQLVPTAASAATRAHLGTVLAGKHTASEALVTLRQRLQFLPGGLNDGFPATDAAATSRLVAELRSLSGRGDVVVVDAAAGMTPWADRLWGIASQAMVVCRRDTASVRAAYGVLKLADQGHRKRGVRVLINGCQDVPQAERAGERIARTAGEFLSMRLEPTSCLPMAESRVLRWTPGPLIGDVPLAGHRAALRGARSSIEGPSAQEASGWLRAVRLLAADLLCTWEAAE